MDCSLWFTWKAKGLTCWDCEMTLGNEQEGGEEVKRIYHIVESNGQNKLCGRCFGDTFYHTQGHSRKYLNKQKTVWQDIARYIATCANCGHKEYSPIFDRLVYTNEKDYYLYQKEATRNYKKSMKR